MGLLTRVARVLPPASGVSASASTATVYGPGASAAGKPKLIQPLVLPAGIMATGLPTDLGRPTPVRGTAVNGPAKRRSISTSRSRTPPWSTVAWLGVAVNTALASMDVASGISCVSLPDDGGRPA